MKSALLCVRFPLVACLLMLLPAGQTAAQTEAFAQYTQGWNLAGGPLGTDLSSAQALFSYDGSHYVVPPSQQTDLCTGYWAYYNAVPTVLLATWKGGDSQTCALRAGWTIVGNPFDAPAALPQKAIAMHWNPLDSTWHQVHRMAPGGAAFVYSPAPGSITLTAQPTGVR